MALTRKQQQIYRYLRDNHHLFPHPPTLAELCQMLGLSSRGSLHRHIQALIDEGLVEPMSGMRRGVRLMTQERGESELPFSGVIAAGKPIEPFPQEEFISVPSLLHSGKNCYVLKVKGFSMIDLGIMEGDFVVIEPREVARNGEIVVALVEGEVTLKRIEQHPNQIILYPANQEMEPMRYSPDQVDIQGVLVGQMRSYL
ncbi:MAG: transcriptional repressor LexA [Gammaproteobacteria bacterium]|nr:transcriptional repressor LexA [Gammaproteobacteria bacterium]